MIHSTIRSMPSHTLRVGKLCLSLVLLASLSLTCGLVLDAVSRARKENKRLAYLAIAPLDLRDR